MQFIPLTPMSIQKVIEVLKESKTFIRSNNIADIRVFGEALFTEDLPGAAQFYSVENENEVIGFLKYTPDFPLPGFTYLRILVLKEKYCGQGIGSKVIDILKAKQKGTLWIESLEDHSSEAFWVSKGFKKEAGRWVL